MSEPAVLSGPHAYHSGINSTSRHPSLNFAYNLPDITSSSRSSSMYLSPALHRGMSTGSLRDLRQQHYEHPPSDNEWNLKQEPGIHRDGSGFFGSPSDEPSSPLQQSYSGDMVSPMTGLPYSPISESFYGHSPPGTGTSSSSAPLSGDASIHRHHFSKHPPIPHRTPNGTVCSEADRKNYSFIALPGNAVKKRPRRRYDEIERLYQCSWPDCTKAYGTLNHLNAHVSMQKHGAKRSPAEFKDLRKKWRAAKKEAETQMTMSLRRNGSLSGHHEEFEYSSRFAFSHPPQRTHSYHPPGIDFQPSLGMNSNINQCTQPVSYSSSNRGSFDSMEYGSGASWAGNGLPSRGQPEAFVSSSVPLHHSHLPQLTITDVARHHSIPMPPSPPRVPHRLPTNSTLFTPLPTYHNQPFIQMVQDNVAYNGDGYDFYDDSSRPGTGNASLGPSSSDETYDDQCF
ncbi:hypothetical protein FA15DRAFT_581729 [Coprinopsis marcescibilis]|uniref:C2H2-type domain-containing protein n=1 Tax=Coprinopsis marcescibilis TaxID=230819 RepID=A0A5C3L9L3_COPMA|nr:hypothetical protein FA15DRAFT_581729 [Coprinopsis marcescibilis]